ncbi:unnamed protein product, partial [Rotaria sordida]
MLGSPPILSPSDTVWCGCSV